MTITLGWWIIPVLITILTFGIAIKYSANERGEWSQLAVAYYYGMALIASMALWLLYFVIREIIRWFGGAK